jgi:hypothetical protein
MVAITRHKYATAHSKAAYLRQIGGYNAEYAVDVGINEGIHLTGSGAREYGFDSDKSVNSITNKFGVNLGLSASPIPGVGFSVAGTYAGAPIQLKLW